MRGGARKGAGRKPGTTKLLVNFKLEGAVVERLRASVPRGRVTKFVEQAISAALDNLSPAEPRSHASRKRRAG